MGSFFQRSYFFAISVISNDTFKSHKQVLQGAIGAQRANYHIELTQGYIDGLKKKSVEVAFRANELHNISGYNEIEERFLYVNLKFLIKKNCA